MIQTIDNLTLGRLAKEESYLEKVKGGFDHVKVTTDMVSPKEFHKDVKYTDANSLIPDNVNHPPHYNNSPAKCECGRRIECIDVTRHMAFNIGNAVKYLWRCELKGNTLEDLNKAAWYIQDEIKEREKSR